MASTPKLPYTAQDTDSIITALSNFMQAANPELWSDWFESNLGYALLQGLAMEGDKRAYSTDMLYQEQFVATSRRVEQAIRFARSVGYVPRAAVSSLVTIVATALPAAIVSSGGTLAAGSGIQGTNGLYYELQTDAVFAIGASNAQLILREGRTLADTFQPTEETFQEFESVEGRVENNSWQVYVGDASSPGNLWTQVDDITFETAATETYQLFFDRVGRATLRFGNGITGKVPADTITLIHRTTVGARGDAAPGVVRGALALTVTGGGGTTVTSLWSNPASATGGLDSESITEMRRSIPAYIRAANQVHTIRDFEEGVVQATSVALAFADQPLASYSGNVVRLHLWDRESTTFTATSPLAGTQSTTPYTRYAEAPSVRMYEAQQYLVSRISVNQHAAMLRPGIAQVDLELGPVVVDAAYNMATLHQDINKAVVSVFTGSSGFAIRLADLYREVLAIPGVRYFNVKRVVFEHIDFGNPVVGVTVVEDFRQIGGVYETPRDITVPGTADRVFYDDSYRYVNEFTYQDEIDRTGIQCINLRTLTFDLTIL